MCQYIIVYTALFRFRIIFIHFVPCVALVCLNAKLIYGVAEAEKKRKALTNRKANGRWVDV